MSGQFVQELFDGNASEDVQYVLDIDANSLSGGMYQVRLSSSGYVVVKKLWCPSDSRLPESVSPNRLRRKPLPVGSGFLLSWGYLPRVRGAPDGINDAGAGHPVLQHGGRHSDFPRGPRPARMLDGLSRCISSPRCLCDAVRGCRG